MTGSSRERVDGRAIQRVRNGPFVAVRGADTRPVSTSYTFVEEWGLFPFKEQGQMTLQYRAHGSTPTHPFVLVVIGQVVRQFGRVIGG